MTQLVMARIHDALMTVDDEGNDVLRRIPNNGQVLVKIVARRSIDQHRLAFGLAAILANNTDFFPSTELAMQAIKIGIGFVDTVVQPDTGEVTYVPRSISFTAMDGTEFGEFLDRAVSLITTRWLVGVEHETVLAKINNALDCASRPKGQPARRRAA